MSASCPTIRGIRIICDIKPSGKRRKEILQNVERGVLTVESVSRLRFEHG